MRRRTQTVGLYSAHVETSWAKSKLIIDDHSSEQDKRVVIEIDRPSDISYLRDQLNKIETYWREQLKAIE